DAGWPNRNRTARSVWSASTLLALSVVIARSKSGSKLHALHTLREICTPVAPIFSDLVHERKWYPVSSSKEKRNGDRVVFWVRKKMGLKKLLASFRFLTQHMVR